MIIAVAQNKGGVGKTTSAIHLAASLHQQEPTLLIDSDPNRNCLGWYRRGEGRLPVLVVSETQAPRHIPGHKHIIIDTKARPDKNDLAEIIEGCDLLILPVSPDAMALETLIEVVDTLKAMRVDPQRYRALITMVPPRPARDGELVYERLKDDGIPVFQTSIRFLKAFKKAALAGVLVRDINDPRAGEGWSDYQQVYAEMVR